MRLLNYLTEDIDNIDEINELIKKDCKYYLSLIGNEMIFTRGAGSSIVTNPFSKQQTRQDRKPSGMRLNTFKHFNKWLKENGHNTRNNAVIGTSLEDILKTDFGYNNFLFPIGKFNFTYAETQDINIDDVRTGWTEDIVDRFFNTNKMVNSLLGGNRNRKINNRKPFESYFHTNKNINIAYKNNYEIWFDCKEYYLASLLYYKWDKSKHLLVSK